MRLIPAIDLRGGRCVRLRNGDFTAETRYAHSPEALLERYASIGAGWVHVVDLDGARDGASAQLPLIQSLAAAGLARLQVGGGLRTRAAVERMLDAGAARVVIGSRALVDPETVAAWLEEFSSDVIAVAFDVRLGADGAARVTTHGWQEQSEQALDAAVSTLAPAALRHVLCTDVGRDGTLGGPNCELYRDAVERFPDIAWQASGGIRTVADLCALRATGVAAAVSGRAMLEGALSGKELRPFLPAA
jgi:phosphoribosylformimino-5-aminoimidazole carboxamide ribotide isomerase